MRPGDRLVLYKDGMIDAVAANQQRFGAARLASVLQASARLPADELCATVFDQIATYQGEADQYDDMTMLVVEVKP